jgi:hypothetical protein
MAWGVGKYVVVRRSSDRFFKPSAYRPLGARAEAVRKIEDLLITIAAIHEQDTHLKRPVLRYRHFELGTLFKLSREVFQKIPNGLLIRHLDEQCSTLTAIRVLLVTSAPRPKCSCGTRSNSFRNANSGSLIGRNSKRLPGSLANRNKMVSGTDAKRCLFAAFILRRCVWRRRFRARHSTHPFR